MAKVKDMSFQKTVKLSKFYNSAEVNFGLTISVEDGDNTQEIKENAWNTIDVEMTKQLQESTELLGGLDHD